MAQYRIAHDLDRTWVCKAEDGSFFWGAAGKYKESHLFRNYAEAKKALDSLPVEKRMYGFPYKPMFMKFYESEEARQKEEAYLANKRLLRDWGEI